MKTVRSQCSQCRRREQQGRGLAVGVTACLLFAVGAAHSGMAQELSKESVLSLSLANKAIAAAIESCKKDGYRVSVSVVDRSGVLRAMGRADGAGPHTVDSSRKKAYTAASVRRPTTELADLISKNPALQGLRDMNQEILILGGGLPIEIGGEVVGGIGVGGAPGAHLDDACAQSGLDAIGAAPKVTVPK
ncbi:MAG: heme-binding protein [Nitrospira sp.]|nr:heme-binding protein [Nitrospira sp.]